MQHTAIASPALAQIKGICTLEATVSDDLDSHREASGSRVLWETSGSAREIPRCFRKLRPTPKHSRYIFVQPPSTPDTVLSNPLALPLQLYPSLVLHLILQLVSSASPPACDPSLCPLLVPPACAPSWSPACASTTCAPSWSPACAFSLYRQLVL